MSLALVTGASRGIGREITLALAAAGHHVIAVSRTPTPETNPNITTIACDISDINAVTKLQSDIAAQHGPVHILVNAAGVFGPIALIKELSRSHYQEIWPPCDRISWWLHDPENQ
jgi:NAD(P)-dependent dehydrogenase (short-subunit alcohol dehydrogenase family)